MSKNFGFRFVAALLSVSYVHVFLAVRSWPKPFLHPIWYACLCVSIIAFAVGYHFSSFRALFPFIRRRADDAVNSSSLTPTIGLASFNCLLLYFCVLELPFNSDVTVDFTNPHLWRIGFFDSVNVNNQILLVVIRWIVRLLWGNTILANVITSISIASVGFMACFYAWKKLFGKSSALILILLALTNPWIISSSILGNSISTAFLTAGLGLLLLVWTHHLGDVKANERVRKLLLYELALGFYIFLSVWLYRASLSISILVVIAVFFQLTVGVFVHFKTSARNNFLIPIAIGPLLATFFFTVYYRGDVSNLAGDIALTLQPNSREHVPRAFAQQQGFVDHVNVDLPIWRGSYFDEASKIDYSWDRTFLEVVKVAGDLYQEMWSFCRKNAFPDQPLVLLMGLGGILILLRRKSYLHTALCIYVGMACAISYVVTGDFLALRRTLSLPLFTAGFAGIAIEVFFRRWKKFSGMPRILILIAPGMAIVLVALRIVYGGAVEVKSEKDLGVLFLMCHDYSVRDLLKNGQGFLPSEEGAVFIARVHDATCLKSAVDTTEFKRVFPHSRFVEVPTANEVPALVAALKPSESIVADCGSVRASSQEENAICKALNGLLRPDKSIASPGDLAPLYPEKNKFMLFRQFVGR